MSRMRCMLTLMIAAWLQFGWHITPAAAQMRVLVVPADASVAVPPRGAALPAGSPRPARRARITRQEIQADRGNDLLGGGTGLAVPFLAILPLAAAVALATSLPGGGGGTSSPARTR